MATVNYVTREVQLKIVLHGPQAAGRATTLGQLHSGSPASRDSLDLSNKEPGTPLTFGYDAWPSEVFEGFGTRVEFHTHTGWAPDEKGLRHLLRDADGIILVADSQWEKLEDNVKSLQEIEEFLKKEEIAAEEAPYVLQYNKRDLEDVAPATYVDFLLNNRPKPAPVFETIATTGENVPEMRKALLEQVLVRLAETYPATETAV